MKTTTRRAAIAGTFGILKAQSQNRQKTNLLFVIADDHAGYVLGANGNKLAETPNLDALAKQSTYFSRHFCNQPVCTPSRQSLITGQLPHAAGVTVLKTPLSEEKPTLPRHLKQAGYQTGVIGKMHFNNPGRAGLHGFDYCVTEDVLNRQWAQSVKAQPLPEGTRAKPPWRPFKDPASIWLNSEKLPFPRREADMKAAYQLKLADEYLGAHKDQPFGLWLSFQEPHSPYDFPYEDRDAIPASRFTAPPVGAEDGWQVPLIFRDLSPEQKQGIAASYYTSVRYLDRNVGRALALLDKHGLAENTLVVYCADHGYCLGQHGRFEKHCGYDPALHVPLMLRHPKSIRAGRVDRFTEHIDLPHTLTDMLGLDPFAVKHGDSLRPYLQAGKPASRTHVFSQYLENEEAFIRTERWKFIIGSGRRKRTDGYETDNPTPGRYVRLFDLKADPGEFTNVAPKQPKAVNDMLDLLLARYRSTHPDVAREPQRLSREEAVEFYLRPRDA